LYVLTKENEKKLEYMLQKKCHADKNYDMNYETYFEGTVEMLR
jgi:hypothetical protein